MRCFFCIAILNLIWINTANHYTSDQTFLCINHSLQLQHYFLSFLIGMFIRLVSKISYNFIYINYTIMHMMNTYNTSKHTNALTKSNNLAGI